MHDDLLTPAEWRVVEFLRHGLTNAAIAGRLGISLYAVRQHSRAAVGKLGLADRAALRMWDSARKGSARVEGTGMQIGELSQIARTVENLDRARAFLRDTLGLHELYAFPGLAFYQLGATRLMIRETGTKGPADILYFRVPSIGTAHETLAQRGVTFTGAPHMIHRHADGTEEWMAFFQDDEGRDLALHAVHPPQG